MPLRGKTFAFSEILQLVNGEQKHRHSSTNPSTQKRQTLPALRLEIRRFTRNGAMVTGGIRPFRSAVDVTM
jgi:hypothetical protein